jgi:hypothetical protein
MARVSLMFSGNPRAMLEHKREWVNYFTTIRERHEMKVFLHSWTEQGFVKPHPHWAGKFWDGQYEKGEFSRFPELLDFLKPTEYTIQYPQDDYSEQLAGIDDIYISSDQGSVHAIMSQLHSIHLANELRKMHPCDIAVRLRMDLDPEYVTTKEIDWINYYPKVPLLFAPNPARHPHPGGGGGCRTCMGFFKSCFQRHNLMDYYAAFNLTHLAHDNDICDIFAVGNATTMDHYCGIFSNIRTIYPEVRDTLRSEMLAYDLDVKPCDGYTIKRIKGSVFRPGGECKIEEAPTLVPEKLLRLHMKEHIVVHSESMFGVRRR